MREVVDKVGIYERRFADAETCSSDLCFAAAEKLIADNNIDRNEIDLLIFISQTPDYRMPATSVLLQDRLELSNSCIAFDVNLGCSAFMYGLSIAFSMVKMVACVKHWCLMAKHVLRFIHQRIAVPPFCLEMAVLLRL